MNKMLSGKDFSDMIRMNRRDRHTALDVVL